MTGQAQATPSTVVWAPSTPAVQGFLVPHLTYDTYFWRGPVAGGAGSPVYPVDTGLTMGILPFSKVNAEIGFDLLLPSQDPLFLNAKLSLVDDAFFEGMPGLAVGTWGVGTKRSGEAQTGYDIFYGMLGHAIPHVGYVAVGGYYGAGAAALWTLTKEDGSTAVNRAGLMASFTLRDIPINMPYLHKIVLATDVQTGSNVYGAVGGAASFYFTPNAALLTGPIYFFEPSVQPGGREWMWTVQLDVDMDLRRPQAAPAGTGTLGSAPAATPPASASAPTASRT